MTSEQGTAGDTFYDAPTQHEEGGNNIDQTSQQAPVGTNATQSDSGALGTGGAGRNRGVVDEQAPLGATGNNSELRGANTHEEALGSKVNNQGAVVDDSFDTQVKGTKDKVAGGFQNLFSSRGKTTDTTNQGVDDDSIETQLRNTKAQIAGTPNVTEQDVHGALNPSRQRGGENASGDDSIETQVRSTGAQVVGTVQGIGSSLKLAGQKIKGAYGGLKDSSKTT